MHQHINNLLNGKIGILAKELAEDVSREFNDTIGITPTGDTAADTKTMLEQLMKNPAKVMNLVKKVGGKLDEKMKSGDISQEELMKEVSSVMENMKNIPGMGDMKSFLKKMGRNFGAGAGAEGMPDFADLAANFGKGARIDTNAVARISKSQQMKDKLRARLESKNRAQVEAAVAVIKAAAAAAPAPAAFTEAELAAESAATAAPPPPKKGGGKKCGKKGKK
jgi:hypothetical protein